MNKPFFLSRLQQLGSGLYNGLLFSNRLEVTYNRLFRRNAPVSIYIWDQRLFFIADCSHGDHIGLGEIFPQREYDHLLRQCGLAGTAIRYVNIGANIGAFDVKLVDRGVGIEFGLSVELNPRTYERCLVNLQCNGLQKTRVINVGVAAADGSIQFSPNRCSLSDNIFDGKPSTSEDTIRVELVSLESLMAKYAGGVAELDLLKMDCEGAEYEIIRATPSIVLRRFRNVLVEFHGEPGGESLNAAYAKLSTAGFSALRTVPGKVRYLELFKRD